MRLLGFPVPFPVRVGRPLHRLVIVASTSAARVGRTDFEREIGSKLPLEIWVWRSISVKDMRTFIHEGWGGRGILRGLYWLEERFPHWFGKNGQYPLVVLRKPKNHRNVLEAA